MKPGNVLSTTLCVAFLCSPPARADDYVGTGGGAIPDDDPAGLAISFDVDAALPVDDVRVTLSMAHTAVGDLEAVLVSPGGLARLVLFGRPGHKRTPSGQEANVDGAYTFDDDAPGDLWATIAGQDTTFDVPAGSYRTSTQGSDGTLGITDAGGCATFLGGAFRPLPPEQSNGTWTLVVADRAASNTGDVLAATLSIDTTDSAVFETGFEDQRPTFPTGSETRGACTPAPLDFTGSGLTSYVVLRNTGGGPTGNVSWFVKDNDGTDMGATTSFVHGTASDFFLTGDYDGDGIADAAVWRSGTFMMRRSSRPDDAKLVLQFGRSGDEPTHGGDYDGDGLDDPTLFRPAPVFGEDSRTLVYLSRSGTIRDFPTGPQIERASGGVDYDGDGTADMAVRTSAGGLGRFTIHNGITGAVASTFDFGFPSDILVTGNHSGTPRGDITIVRGSAGMLLWTTRDGATGAVASPVEHGSAATDFLLVGDYDGDTVEDYAVWRPNADPSMTKFIVRPAAAPSTPFEVFHGQNGDYPVASHRVH